jgi:hypothetical protein
LITDRLPLDVAEALLEISGSGKSWAGYSPVHDEQVDTRRWVSAHRVIVRRDSDGSLWALPYEQPLTEYQECDTFADSPVTVTRVRAKEVVTVEYVTFREGDQ